jgi:hypothetical protein
VRLAAIALTAATLAGCKQAPDYGYAVEVTIRFDASIADAQLATVSALRIDVSGTESFHPSYPVTRPGREARWVYLPAAPSGSLRFAVTALDGANATVGYGVSADVPLVPGKTTSARVDVSAAVAPFDGGGGSDGPCSDGCSPLDATRCAGAQVQRCSRGLDGCLAWSAPADCAAPTPACSSVLGRCACTVAACAATGGGCDPTSGACVVCTPLPSNATDFYVDAGGGSGATGSLACPYPTITQALAAANASSATAKTIHVAAGSYGGGETLPLVLRGAVSLVGAGPSVTSLTGVGSHVDANTNLSSSQKYATIVVGTANMSQRIAGLALHVGVGVAPMYAILCDRGNAPATGGTAVPAPSLVVDQVQIDGVYQVGIGVTSPLDASAPGCSLSLTRSTVRTGTGVSANGCQSIGPSMTTVAIALGDDTPGAGNQFSAATFGAVLVSNCVNTRIVGNTFTSSTEAIYLGGAPPGAIDIEYNTFDGLSQCGIEADGSSVLTLKGNTFSNIPTGPATSSNCNAGLYLNGRSQVDSATLNKFFGNAVGVLVAGQGMNLSTRAKMNFGNPTFPGGNVFSCNSAIGGIGALGFDFWIALNTNSDGTPITLVGNKWDHAMPTMASSQNGTDLAIDAGGMIAPAVSYSSAQSAGLACPTGRIP